MRSENTNDTDSIPQDIGGHRFRDIFENASDAILVVNPQTRAILEANHRLREMLGYSDEQLHNLKIGAFSSGIPPFTSERAYELICQCATGKHMAFEWHAKRKNGQLFWIDVALRPAQMAGDNVLIAVIRDITERKRAEQTLREGDEFLRSLTSNSPVGIYTTDVEGRCTYVNASWCKMAGISPEEARGHGWERALHPDDTEKTKSGWYDAAANNAAWNCEYRFLARDGKVTWVLGVSKQLCDDQGRPVGYIGVISDITDRKRAEEALRESEAGFRLLAENSTDVICRHTPDGRYAYVSPAIKTQMGYEPEEMIGRTAYEFVHPDDLERLAALHQSGLEQGADEVVTCRWRRKDGSYVWVESTFRTIQDEKTGVTIEAQSSSRNITDRLRAEAETRAALEETERFFNLVPDPVCVASTDGYFKKLNPAWEKVLGYTTEELLSRPFSDFIHPEDTDYTCRELHKQATSGKTNAFVNRYRCKDGSYRWLAWTSNSAVDGDTLYAIARDITRHIVAATELTESERRYRLLFENMTAGFALCEVIYDSEGKPADYRYLEVNPAFEALTGVRATDMLGRTLREVLSNVEQSWFDMFNMVAFTGKPSRRQDYSKAFGRYYDVYAFCPSKGRFAVMFTDMTEQTQAQQALRESEEKLRGIYDNAPVAIFQSTKEGCLLSANPTAVRMFGYDSEEEMLAVGGDIGKAYFVYPEKRRMIAQAAMESDGYVMYENDYRRKDGTEFVANLHMRAVRKDGEVTFVEGFVEDVTERKRAEAEKRALEQSMEEHKRRFYRETILSVTNGKLSICDSSEVEHYKAEAQVEIEISQPSDVGEARLQTEKLCQEFGLDEDQTSAFIVGAGEAITNALKHASGGRAYAGKTASDVWIAVEDHGPGIESLVLPRAVLRRGFSTKLSMGLGYSIMLDVADSILLKTDPSGTTVVLIKSAIHTPLSLDSIPDTW